MRLSTLLSAIVRRLDLILPLVVLIAALVVRVYEPPLVERLRNLAFDSYQRLLPRPVGDAPVRIIDIDEASLAKIGQWPWPRDILAQLVDRLSEAGAEVHVVVDLDVDVLRLHPGELGLEHDRVLGVEDVHRGRPDGRAGALAERAPEQPVDLLAEGHHVTERVPPHN